MALYRHGPLPEPFRMLTRALMHRRANTNPPGESDPSGWRFPSVGGTTLPNPIPPESRHREAAEIHQCVRRAVRHEDAELVFRQSAKHLLYFWKLQLRLRAILNAWSKPPTPLVKHSLPSSCSPARLSDPFEMARSAAMCIRFRGSTQLFMDDCAIRVSS